MIPQDEQILEYIKTYGKITRAIVQNMLGIERTRANNILAEMCNRDLIKKEGVGKSTKYVLKQLSL